MKTFTYAQIWTIASTPFFISTLMEQLIGMTDAAFLGRVGEIELGASALGGIFYIAVFMLGFGFSIGAQILMARRNGEGNYERIGTIFYHSLAFLFLMACTLWTHPLAGTGDIGKHHLVARCVRSHQCLYRLARIWLFLRLYQRHVSRLLCSYHSNPNLDAEFRSHGVEQRSV